MRQSCKPVANLATRPRCGHRIVLKCRNTLVVSSLRATLSPLQYELQRDRDEHQIRSSLL